MSSHDHAPHRNYVKIWTILVGLLVVSVVGPMFGIRVVTLITAFGIAVVKAYIVAKNFMHLDVEKRIIHWTLAVAVVLMVLLFAGVSPDVMQDHGQRWKKGPGFHPVEAAGHHGAPAGSAPGHGAPAAGHGETPSGATPEATPAAEDSAGGAH